ncbi:pyruvate dehydrogenase (acetyl-transferring) E1 component subunit alpha [Ornithobacterium rhinotracheale]|uniref:Pyruvate dehydrogenase E1 component subunit alpha n=1 Tax=Ornithobacterium rhinotracheale (strain ATCC 51463 / DSM 15997 / CCUG 23171 / CIP 104009 / LMG 9086) TaxID=867902 RepID=I4A291_ORNRL|nr:pyruvate dehydrogenase (acetyl-transferring) E1 component subunit alpha [Ornithobacterium rhinotracheale]AFL98075.1 pyruvate dehydrogenase E1 component, alpha subunit [Ornithobacterium rhinotracheale DSM 15997]AIP99849.1 pyruvate dehydrogenase E1 subunit alpha [Ornithobacterium rhinotracheale ORT-UMN 88]KGB66040.1 pyruvate dehydrogenase E1 subunit alpha [Ornithobacterium rhinotracheale H06-030791]MBN3661718.1 pyruvate dehydrogenase (acetyl-transferring) E1 component subunit alpha [Ornithobac
MKEITKETYLKWFEEMTFWRRFEDKCRSMYLKQKIRGFLHLYNGQEAIPAGLSQVMDMEKDKMITAYRCHVLPMAMGVDPKRIMAELFGKVDGTSHGMGGSMHVFSKEHNFFGGHGIVGGQIALGAGIAFADKYFERGGVTFCFMGDGATRQGSLHETFNMAMNWKLPVVFICENNQYAMGTSVKRTANHEDIYKLADGYEMPSQPVDGMDPVKVAEAAYEAIERARRGDGPTFLDIKTYRYRGHSMSDAEPYRTKEEVNKYKEQDPILLVQHRILENGWATEEELNKITDEQIKKVDECVDFAEKSPFPEVEQIYSMVYEQENYPFLDKVENQ